MSRTSKISVNLLFVIIALSFLKTDAQSLSQSLLKAIPDAQKKIKSDDVRERISILQDIVKPGPKTDVVSLILPFDLSSNDYSFVIKKILEKDLTLTDENLPAEVFWKIGFLAQKFQLKQFAKTLAKYLTKFEAGVRKNSKESRQFIILEILKHLKVREVDSLIVPLLQSSENYIRREALQTLIEINSRKAVPVLVQQLNNKNAEQRFNAIRDLVKLNARETAGEIAKLLDDENDNNSYWAVDALVKFDTAKYAPQIWKVLDKKISENKYSDANRRNYAIAALVKFREEKAVPLAVSQVTVEDLTIRLDMLSKLVELDARAAIPALVKALKSQDLYIGEGTDSNIRRDIMVALGRFQAKEAVPVLLSYIAGNPRNGFLQTAAIETLAILDARESSGDILNVFNSHLSNMGKPMCQDFSRDECHNQDFLAIDAALALAKIGDQKIWKLLIDFAEHSKNFRREEIFFALNRQIDRKLWKKISTYKTPGPGWIVIAEEYLSLMSRGFKIPISWEPLEKKSGEIPSPDSARGKKNCHLNAPVGQNALEFIFRIPDTNFVYCGAPERLTVIFDHGTIRILPVKNAIRWWRENILNKQNA